MRLDFSKFGSIRDQMLTVVVLIIALVMMVMRQDDAFQNMRIMALYVVSTLEAPLSNVRVYRTALQTNEELERQNILLQDEISRLRVYREENETLRRLLAMQDSTEFDLSAVRIVSKNLTGINNNMIINAGKNKQIEPGMPVLNADGLVGQVVLTGDRVSMVLPLLNTQFRVSVMIEGSRAAGIVSWEGTGLNELVLRYVPQTIPITAGMRVKTSGLSNQFPFGIPVGEVTRTEPEQGKETQLIFLRPFVNLYTLAEAHVMLYKADKEIEQLEDDWYGNRP